MLKRFKSYLSNRHHSAKINNIPFDLTTLTHRIPQKSVLGPIIYIIIVSFQRCLYAFNIDYNNNITPNQTYNLSANKFFLYIFMHDNNQLTNDTHKSYTLIKPQ